MIITIASYKGGVGKTTTAIHLAAYLQRQAATLLVDGDPNRSATVWTTQGGLPFKVIDERLLARHARHYEHIVIDTEARPTDDDLKTLIEGCDLLILPSTPDLLALNALKQTIEGLERLGAASYKVLLTIAPPRPNRDGEEAQAMLRASGVPVFAQAVTRRIVFQKAALAGVPVSQLHDARATAAWAEYEAVGKEIL